MEIYVSIAICGLSRWYFRGEKRKGGEDTKKLLLVHNNGLYSERFT